MKKVFIVVCVIASFYLLAQISPVKRVINDVTVALSSQPTEVPVNQELISELEQKLLEIELDNIEVKQELQERLSLLERDVDELSQQTEIVSNTNESPNEQSQVVSKQINNKVAAQIESTSLTSDLRQTSLKHDENNKRLQQQAALRDLSEQLELMALASLSN